MSTWPTNTSLKLKWLSIDRPSAPSFNLNIWLSPFKSLCLILTWGRGIIHCHTVDTVMGMGVHDTQHTMASPRQSQTLGTDIHLPFRDQFDKWKQTNKGLAPHRRVWQQTLSVWQQTYSWSGNRQFD